MTQPSDERLGIVRLNLPDGRELKLQWTWAAIDRLGNDAIIAKLKTCQRGVKGVGQAVAALLEAASSGAIMAVDVMEAPAAEYPVNRVFDALWQAWALAQYGPDGRPAGDGPENPRKQKQTLFGRLWPWRGRMA